MDMSYVLEKVEENFVGMISHFEQTSCMFGWNQNYPQKSYFNSSFDKICVIQSCDKIPLLGAYGHGCTQFFGKKWKKILLAWFHILSRQVVSLGMLQSSRYEPEAHKVLLNCCLWQNQVKELPVRIIQKYLLICLN